MKIINILIFLSFNLCFSQGTLKGVIVDSQNKHELAYVNIGFANKNMGTVSDNSGNFMLKLNHVNSNDTITISHIGYKTKEYNVSALLKTSNLVIELEPDSTTLDEVVIKNMTQKPKTIGRKGKGLGLIHLHFNTYYEDVDDLLSKEMGVRMNLSKDCKIETLNFNITSNEFKSLKFRVNFYNLKRGLPKDLLNAQDIIFEIKDEFLGWYQVDLKPYNLYFEKDLKEIVVAIQWLESKKTKENSKWFSISTATATSKKTFIRNKAMDKWKDERYKPSFYLGAKCK